MLRDKRFARSFTLDTNILFQDQIHVLNKNKFTTGISLGHLHSGTWLDYLIN